MAETRGRKPTFNDPEYLRTKIDEYFEECEKKKVFADEAGMLIFCKLDKKKKNALLDESNPKAEAFEEIFDNAALRRESLLARRMCTDNKAANGCMNLLKQKANGGYTDKPVNGDGATELKIHIVGGHGAELFK